MRFTLRFALAAAMTIGLGVAVPANATIINYVVPLSGANEVLPVVGDPDGSGTATLTIDDVALTISWSIVVANLDPVILDHIHSGAAGVNGPVVVDFGGVLVGGPLAAGGILAAIVLNPSAYYVNVHTTVHTGGAIRGQVPEPGTALLLAMGLLGLAGATRRR